MTGLRGGMDDRVGSRRVAETSHRIPHAYVDFVVREPRAVCYQTRLVPAGIPLRTKEIRTHVVVKAVYFPTEIVKVSDHLGADQPVRTCDEYRLHAYRRGVLGSAIMRRSWIRGIRFLVPLP